jgi:hypothetical protein
VLWRRPGQRAGASAAPLRLRLAPKEGRLAVHVLKRRGAELPQPIIVDVEHRANIVSSVLPALRRRAPATH